MAYERTKVLTTFAIFGFIVGTIAYFIFNWFVSNNLIRFTPPSIVNVMMSPWFVSGTVGALLSTIIVVVFAHFSRNR
ncbi:MAG: hypothetical protein NWE83_02765 [Candidatus Bathyarchaeota archaeon]|nr:hypothetical protein [Candidatus Bathyarchaeota archaeon]